MFKENTLESKECSFDPKGISWWYHKKRLQFEEYKCYALLGSYVYSDM